MAHNRLSRWGRSPYETEADLRAERELLSAHLQVVGPSEPAEVIVVTSKDPVGPALESRLGPVKLVVTTTSGVDHLDLPFLRSKGIAAARCPIARRDAVVQSSLALMLSLIRSHNRLEAEGRSGRWARGRLAGMSMGLLGDRPIGLVGLGVIGSSMAKTLHSLGVEVWGSDPMGVPEGVREATLGEMARQCSAVSLHCSLTTDSNTLIDSEFFQESRSDLVLVNTARGDVLDVPAALAALRAGHLGGLALDVFPEEPWPDMAQSQVEPRLVLLPHAAGYHNQLASMIRKELQNVVTAWVNDQPLPWRVV